MAVTPVEMEVPMSNINVKYVKNLRLIFWSLFYSCHVFNFCICCKSHVALLSNFLKRNVSNKKNFVYKNLFPSFKPLHFFVAIQIHISYYFPSD